MDRDAQDVGDGREMLAGLDALRFLCSNFGKKQACMPKSNVFSKLYSEVQAQETSASASPPPTSTLCSPRKQRKAKRPSRVVPLTEAPSLHENSALTDDPPSLKSMSNCLTAHDDSGLRKKKSGISGNGPLAVSDSHIESSTMTKATKGKRNKRQNPQYDATIVCKNLACKAVLHAGAPFCKRCSCCICKQFDDNKDPSLWITCDAEEQDGCGLSCHVECALRDRVAGVVRKSGPVSLDGSFFCRSCGKVSSLISLWKKQLLIAKNARRVDVFCQRLLLSHRLLKGTLKYKDVHSPIESAVERLKVEVGLMTKCSSNLERCIVNRLSCNIEVQKMIDLALEKVESLCKTHSVVVDAKDTATRKKPVCAIQFEDARSSSIVVVAVDDLPGDERLGYKLWHRKATDPSYPEAPTHTIQGTSTKVLVSNLQPRTLYAFKMAPFSAERDGEECEAECCTEDEESRVVENLADNSITDFMHETKKGETKGVQSPQQHSPTMFECVQEGRTENCEGAVEDLSNANLPSVPEVSEGKDNNSVEELGDVIVDMNEEPKSSKKDACESLEFPRVTDTHDEELKNRQQEEALASKNVLKCSPTMAANIDITDNSNAAPQSGAIQLLCDGAQGGNIAGAGDGKRDAPGVQSKINLRNFEFVIRVVRWLECQGHLDKEFRQKFLTWYSLRATEHEKRVVSVFIDTLQDNAASLAAQLVDTFQDVINAKRQKGTEIGYYRRRFK